MATDLLDLPTETPEQKPLTPVTLKTRRDMGLVTRAIDHEVKNLEKLAKTNREAGYWNESRVMAGDVAALKHEISPAFREQQEIAFATSRNIASGAAESFRDVIEKAKATKMPVEQLLDELGRRVARFGIAVADLAYEAGYAARETGSASITTKALRKLSANGDEDEEE